MIKTAPRTRKELREKEGRSERDLQLGEWKRSPLSPQFVAIRANKGPGGETETGTLAAWNRMGYLNTSPAENVGKGLYLSSGGVLMVIYIDDDAEVSGKEVTVNVTVVTVERNGVAGSGRWICGVNMQQGWRRWSCWRCLSPTIFFLLVSGH